MEKLVSNREDIERIVEEAYDSWVQEMKDSGWKYSKVVDLDKKESPYIVPYKDLSLRAQTEYRVFAHILNDVIWRRKKDGA
jgi:hypothetical protein